MTSLPLLPREVNDLIIAYKGGYKEWRRTHPPLPYLDEIRSEHRSFLNYIVFFTNVTYKGYRIQDIEINRIDLDAVTIKLTELEPERMRIAYIHRPIVSAIRVHGYRPKKKISFIHSSK